MPNCRSCKADVLWVILESEKRHPINPEPVHDFYAGEAIDLRKIAGLVAVPVDPVERSRVVKGDDPIRSLAGRALYESHYASCPDAEKWRGGRRGG